MNRLPLLHRAPRATTLLTGLLAGALNSAWAAEPTPSTAPASSAGQKNELPLLEAGVGVGVLHGPAYLGSSVYRSHVAPLPYIVYRGERLHANREGIGLGLITQPRLRLDLSLSGALPVRSSGTAREGMRDLPPVIEVGPVLKYRLLREGDRYWAVHWPIRYGVGLRRENADNVGWISDPTLRGVEPFHIGGVRVDWGIDLSVKFQSERFNNYYYGVRQSEATATRASYHSGGGYAGTTLSTGLLARFDHVVAGAFIGASDLSGARFVNSPLVERRHNYFGGVAVFWVLHKSEQMVPQQLFR